VALPLLALVVAGQATPVRGQSATEPPPAVIVSVEVRDGVTRGEALHAEHRPREALESFLGALVSDSTRFDALWRAARETVSLGMLAGERAEAKRWFSTGEEYARRAIRSDPESALGHQWLAITMGRRALLENPGERVGLAESIRASAQKAIALDPTAAGAHNALGQWHAELEGLGGLARFIAERFLGAETFAEASWDEAERHLARAVELEPEALIHRVALAKVYLATDRPRLARAQLERAIGLPLAEPTDRLTRTEAEDLLRELG
jgi:tetratricopeptide (TPR) repeat protein